MSAVAWPWVLTSWLLAQKCQWAAQSDSWCGFPQEQVQVTSTPKPISVNGEAQKRLCKWTSCSDVHCPGQAGQPGCVSPSKCSQEFLLTADAPCVCRYPHVRHGMCGSSAAVARQCFSKTMCTAFPRYCLCSRGFSPFHLQKGSWDCTLPDTEVIGLHINWYSSGSIYLLDMMLHSSAQPASGMVSLEIMEHSMSAKLPCVSVAAEVWAAQIKQQAMLRTGGW